MRRNRPSIPARISSLAGRRGGTVALELLFALPVLLTVLLGVIEFSLLVVAQQQLATACREGARVAAQGGTLDDVTQAVQQFLGTGVLSNATIVAVLTDDSGQPIPSRSPISVTVSLPANQAAPDLLAFIGFSIGGKALAAQTVMRKE
jgi:Flp pilus assembly protein TadG